MSNAVQRLSAVSQAYRTTADLLKRVYGVSAGQVVAAIAMEIGYKEPNYFSHVFRKLEGITPKEYRQRMTQNDPSSDQ